MLTPFIIVFSLLLDAILGEPKRWHPLVGFGNIAKRLESKLNLYERSNNKVSLLLGLFSWGMMVIPITIFIAIIEQQLVSQPLYHIIFATLCLSFSLGTKSLVQHAKAVNLALKSHNIPLARKKVSLIVSRDTSQSDETAITRATIESVLENGSDAIFAALFWFLLFGAWGVIFYRLSNTLDAMWGYKTSRYRYFGRVAARIDDILNWLPARLTALSYALIGNTKKAFLCWKTQAQHWHGINPGVVMASGAGALSILLGGKASYHGEEIIRPELGCTKEPVADDIQQALQLIYKSVVLWVAFIIVGHYLIEKF